MKALVQRVKDAKVVVDNKITGKINDGLLVYLGIHKTDTEKEADYIVNKIINLRIFEDESGKMNLSALTLNKEILIISQFTLYGNTKKGFRPNFMDSMEPESAKKLYNYFVKKTKKIGLKTQTGIFGAMMDVSYTNNGPVSIIIEKLNEDK